MSARIKPHKVKGRQLEEVREKDPDGRIVVHHRTVDTLGKMLRAGTIDEAMHDAAKDFQADFIIASLDPLRALPILRVPGPGRARAQDTDRHVGARMRERRIMLGLTQHEMAELIGVTYQQAHKYEKGINRVAAGRLYQIAQALGVEVGYFFEGLGRDNAVKVTPQQRLLLELGRNFIAIPIRKHQDAICSLARALAEPDAGH